MDAVLRFKCFGGLAITLGDEPVPDFVSAKARALLCFMVLSGGSHSRSTLAGLLWSEVGEEKARANLRMALSGLRKWIPAHLQVNRKTIELHPEKTLWVDAEIFRTQLETHLQEGEDVTEIEAAVDLYQGDFLEEHFIEDASLFEEWVFTQREQLRAMAIQALHRLTDHHIARGEYDKGIKSTSRMLALEPWREEAHRQMMLLLSRSGQRSTALVQYEKCRDILAEELDVEPMASTTKLYERIKSASVDPPSHLPQQPTPFIGREEELAQLFELLENPDCRLLTLMGTGGIGKTRLAIELAKRKVDRFLQGVFFIPFASVASLDVIPYAMAKAIDLQLSSVKDPKDQLRDYLQDKEMLLVLDNFEHLLEATPLLIDLLNHTTEVKLLTTSRRALNLSWEWTFEVKGLTFPSEEEAKIECDPVETYSAVDLFLSTVQRIKGSSIPKRELPHTIRICQQLSGIPLGIEMAASWARTKSSRQIAQAIELSLMPLQTSMKDVRQRHRSLQAVFDHSWHLLSEEEKQLFPKLSVFRGGFTLEAAQPLDETNQTNVLLASLVEQSLLRMEEKEDACRFFLLEPVRQYGANKLEDQDEWANVSQQHLKFFLQFAEQAEPKLKGAHQADWFARLETEHDNLRAALQWAIDFSIDEGLRLAIALWRFWVVRGHVKEGQRWLEKALMASPDDDSNPMRAKALLYAARASDLLGDPEGAKDQFEACVKRYRSLGDHLGIAQSLNGLANVVSDQGDVDEAITMYREALDLSRQVKDQFLEAAILGNLSILRMWQKDYAGARSFVEQSLTIKKEQGDARGMAFSLNRLGLIAMNQKDYSAAIANFQESAAIRKELGDQQGIAEAHHHLGAVHYLQGDLDNAQKHQQESLAIYEKLNGMKQVAAANHQLGLIYLERSENARAWAHLDRSLSLNVELVNKRDIAQTMLVMVELLTTEDHPKRAVRLLSVAVKLVETIDMELEDKDLAEVKKYRSSLSKKLGSECFEKEWSKGRTLSIQQATDLALTKH